MRYYFNIGTNLGDRHQNVGRAIAALCALGTRCRVSKPMESEPWGFDSANRFLNVGVALDLDLPPHEVLDCVHDIERRLGSAAHRHADGSYADRLVDIDIMAIDDPHGQPVDINTPTLTVPHPHLHDRDFFLLPYQQLKHLLD
ncbi:MAG: 2-amino-4-hydroxy-6-hydroxymethyldihydropteridine diphosphokinase [Muribaculaceae bacterium]|nr:2-amino-4-hydroxy-6-hydroxymethyldihydropteridine diphosphokinase [Muribaculaceae bacterium]